MLQMSPFARGIGLDLCASLHRVTLCKSSVSLLSSEEKVLESPGALDGGASASRRLVMSIPLDLRLLEGI